MYILKCTQCSKLSRSGKKAMVCSCGNTLYLDEETEKYQFNAPFQLIDIPKGIKYNNKKYKKNNHVDERIKMMIQERENEILEQK